MTKQEAIDTLSELRKSFKALNPTKAMQAYNTLFNSSGVVTSFGTQLGLDFSRALTTLRQLFEAMDNSGL